jgi:hypothetical protein
MTGAQINWDVRDSSGGLVADLPTLASVLNSDLDLAAKTLLESPSVLLAPAELVQQAQAHVKAAKPKPGDGTPPPISTGTFVSWPGGRGRVALVVTNGKVPGIEDEMEGSASSPAAQVVVWERSGDGYKPSRKKVGAKLQTLKRIAPLQSGKKSSAVTSATRLVEMIAEHEQRIESEDLGETARVSGASVKSVYERGLAAWPGVLRTGLTREEWAQERVKAFMNTAAGMTIDNYVNDHGLLAKSHPKHPDFESKAIMDVTPSGADGVEYVTIDQDEVNQRIQDLLADV